MLALVSHERYFALLREEVKFGRKVSKSAYNNYAVAVNFLLLCRSVDPDATTFHLLHISLLREYIDLEFSDVKVTTGFVHHHGSHDLHGGYRTSYRLLMTLIGSLMTGC